MRTKLDTKSLILGLLAGAVVALTVAATNEKNVTTWEYRVITDFTSASPSDPSYAALHTQSLNLHAVQGWEVVSSHTLAKDGTTSEKREIILRRAK